MRKENLLLVIDMQNDFCLPTGALYVDGAEKDVKALNQFIVHNANQIDEIVLTQDTHSLLDISHPGFWKDKEGNIPAPFTQIVPEDVLKGNWKPIQNEVEVKQYIQNLYQQGEYPHVIWPEHCIEGTEGVAIVDELMEVINKWAVEGRSYEIIQKGLNPLTEHFGALRANIPIDSDAKTQTNMYLVDKLKEYKQIFIAGEAKSHCVANTVKQLCEIEGLVEKLIILEDTMSNVTGFETLADPIYARALEMGARIETTDTITLK